MTRGPHIQFKSPFFAYAYAFVRVLPTVAPIVVFTWNLFDPIIASLPAGFRTLPFLRPVLFLAAIPTFLIVQLAVDLALFGLKKVFKSEWFDVLIATSFLRDATKQEAEDRKWPGTLL